MKQGAKMRGDRARGHAKEESEQSKEGKQNTLLKR
jgi:hypothetical protein